MKQLSLITILTIQLLSQPQPISLNPGDDKVKIDTNRLRSIHLMSDEGNNVDLENYKSSKAIVFIFLSPECPISQKYAITMENIHNKYAARDIKFFGVFSDDYADSSVASTFKKEYNIGFPMLLDKDYLIADLTDATITPEVCIIDSNGVLQYRGMIDNWFVALGKKRRVITKNYLDEALECISNNKEVEIPYNKAVGCFLHLN